MSIYTMCVDRENGRYLAISVDDPDDKAFGSSEEEALGKLVMELSQDITIDNIVSIDTAGK